MDEHMRRAVALSADNVREGGQPFGAVLVRGDERIAEGVNELHKTYDVSGHAELVAIRRAQEQLQTHDLSGCAMYASGEPCPMCLTAMYYAGINQLYYCASMEDAAAVGLGASADIYADIAKPREERMIASEKVSLEDGQEDPMELWYEHK